MFTHMHYRVLGVGSLRIQGPVEREYLNNSGQAGQSVNAIEGSARVGVRTPSSRLSSVSAGLSVGIFLIEGLGSLGNSVCRATSDRRDSWSASAIMAAAAAAAVAVYMLMRPASRQC